MTLGDNLYNLEDDEARPLDEHGKILSFPRGHVVKSFLWNEEVTGSVPRISEDVCIPLAQRGQRAEKLDPQEQWSTRDRVFPRWFYMVFVSTNVMVTEIFELMEQYIVRSKSREPMSRCKHQFIGSGAYSY